MRETFGSLATAGAVDKFVDRNCRESSRTRMAHKALGDVKAEIDTAKLEDKLLAI